MISIRVLGFRGEFYKGYCNDVGCRVSGFGCGSKISKALAGLLLRGSGDVVSR